MKEFSYVINDELGIHARPAGLLVKMAGKYKSQISIEKDGKEIDLRRLIQLMSLQVKYNDEVTIKAEGEDESLAIIEIEKFIKENL
jgi:phosphocarrier protein